MPKLNIALKIVLFFIVSSAFSAIVPMQPKNLRAVDSLFFSYNLFDSQQDPAGNIPTYDFKIDLSNNSNISNKIESFMTDMNSVKNGTALGRCNNFIINHQSYCQKDLFEIQMNKLNQKIESQWQQEIKSTIYPIFVYNKAIHQIAFFACRKWNSSDLYRRYKQVKSQYQQIANKIKQQQIKYINQKSCLMCLGPKDKQTFIHQILKSENKSVDEFILFDKKYLAEKIDRYANFLMDFQALHKISAKIYFDSLNKICFKLNPLEVISQQQIQNLKLCYDLGSCRKIAASYLGYGNYKGNLSFLYYINNLRSPAVFGSHLYFVENSTYGFKGNFTYKANQKYQKLPTPIHIYNKTPNLIDLSLIFTK